MQRNRPARQIMPIRNKRKNQDLADAVWAPWQNDSAMPRRIIGHHTRGGMGKKNKNGYGKGTFIDTKLFLSSAFISLGKPGSSEVVSYCSSAILIMLMGKRQFGTVKDRKGQKVKQRTDENRFHLTYKELQHWGISQTAATRGVDELLAKGFIQIAVHGGAYDKHKNEYSLVDDWTDWQPGDPPIRIRPKDFKRGYQGPGQGGPFKNRNRTRTRWTGTHTHARDTPSEDTHARDGHPKHDRNGQDLYCRNALQEFDQYRRVGIARVYVNMIIPCPPCLVLFLGPGGEGRDPAKDVCTASVTSLVAYKKGEMTYELGRGKEKSWNGKNWLPGR